jgi:endonuclease-3
VVESIIHRSGFFRVKTQYLLGLSRRICDEFDGQVPSSLDELVTLPGVGRKTANVVRSVALGEPGLPVDTHVIRLSHRLGLVRSQDPVAIERELCSWVEPQATGTFSLRLIYHGRRVCRARRPLCAQCTLVALCPAATGGLLKSITRE